MNYVFKIKRLTCAFLTAFCFFAICNNACSDGCLIKKTTYAIHCMHYFILTYVSTNKCRLIATPRMIFIQSIDLDARSGVALKLSWQPVFAGREIICLAEYRLCLAISDCPKVLDTCATGQISFVNLGQVSSRLRIINARSLLFQGSTSKPSILFCRSVYQRSRVRLRLYYTCNFECKSIFNVIAPFELEELRGYSWETRKERSRRSIEEFWI